MAGCEGILLVCALCSQSPSPGHNTPVPYHADPERDLSTPWHTFYTHTRTELPLDRLPALRFPKATSWTTGAGRGHHTKEAEAGDFQKDQQHQTCCCCADWLTKGRGKRASLRQAAFCSSFLLLGSEKHTSGCGRKQLNKGEGVPFPCWTPW